MLIHTLKKALMQGSVSLTRHRMDLISGLVCALMQVRSVNLRKLACSLPGMAQIDSQYRRLQRFFSSALSPAVFTELIVSKLVRPGQPQVLVMDRTHWKLGRTDLNLLCVGLVYQGVSIPLAYQSLQKPGNSHTDERKHLLTQVWAYLDASVCCLVADREFIGALVHELAVFPYGAGLWCMNWRFFRMGRLNKDRLLSRLGMTFLRKNLCLLFQGTCFGQPIVLPPFRQAPSPISPSLSSRVSGA